MNSYAEGVWRRLDHPVWIEWFRLREELKSRGVDLNRVPITAKDAEAQKKSDACRKYYWTKRREKRKRH